MILILAILNVLTNYGNSKSYMTFEHMQVHGMNLLMYKGQCCLIAQRNMNIEKKRPLMEGTVLR
jgi:hypothetical protein